MMKCVLGSIPTKLNLVASGSSGCLPIASCYSIRSFHEFLGKSDGRRVITARRPKIAHYTGCQCTFCTSRSIPDTDSAVNSKISTTGGLESPPPLIDYTGKPILTNSASGGNSFMLHDLDTLMERAANDVAVQPSYKSAADEEYDAMANNIALQSEINKLYAEASAAYDSVGHNTRDAQVIEAENRVLQEEIQKLKSRMRRLDPTSVQSAFVREDPDIAQLLKNNVNWVKTAHEKDPEFFKRIGGPQRPKYLYIGCSDSRVPANQILGLGPGEVFVHRNVGNQVVGNDLNVLSGIEFAVDVLNVQHIIVTGHYGCGACYAATQSGRDLGLLENWLRSLRDIYRNHHTVLDSIEDPEERHRKFVEVSVVEQCLNLYKTGIVQKKRKETSQLAAKEGQGKGAYPRIHAMVFDPAVGLLKKLPIDFKTSVHQFRHIYDLY